MFAGAWGDFLSPQNKEGILPVASDTNVTQLTVLGQRCTFSEAEVYIDVYKDDDNFASSGATLLSDLDLQESYKAIDSVATGKIPFLFCAIAFYFLRYSNHECNY